MTECAGRLIYNQQSQQEHSNFHAGGPHVERVELQPRRIVESGAIEIPDLRAQGDHARRDPELRNQGEREHHADQQVAHREYVRRAVGHAAVEQGTGQKDDPGDDGDPVQLGEQIAD